MVLCVVVGFKVLLLVLCSGMVCVVFIISECVLDNLILRWCVRLLVVVFFLVWVRFFVSVENVWFGRVDL